jgi:hypothetical protein
MQMDLLEFRRRVSIHLLASKSMEITAEALTTSEQLRGRPSQLKQLSDPRHLASDHFIMKNPDGRRLRCRLCKSTTSYVCRNCLIGINAKCFSDYHSNV